MYRLVYCIFLSVILCSCQTASKAPEDKSRHLDMVSISDKSYVMSPPQIFSWKPGGSHFIPNKKIKTDSIKPVIESVIVDTLQNKGYKFAQDVGRAQLQISYYAALEEQMNSDEITRRFGVMPGFRGKNPDNSQYGKGAIIIDIRDAKLDKSIWRGAIQGLAEFKLSQQERHERIDKAIRQLMTQLPGRQ